jgi:hypothetical protein
MNHFQSYRLSAKKYCVKAILVFVSLCACAPAFADCLPGGIYEEYWGYNRALAGRYMCTMRGWSPSDCSRYGGDYKDDSGSGTTACFLDPRSNTPTRSTPAQPPGRPNNDGLANLHKSFLQDANREFNQAMSEFKSQEYDRCNASFSSAAIDFDAGKDAANAAIANKNSRRCRCLSMFHEWSNFSGIDQLRNIVGLTFSTADDETTGRNVCSEFPEIKAQVLAKIEERKAAQKAERANAPADTSCSSPDLPATAWCSSAAPGRSPQNACVDPGVKTGSNNYSYKLNLACSGQHYMAMVYVGDGDDCRRDVISLSRSETGQLEAAGVSAPQVRDAIVFSDADMKNGIVACYTRRHRGRPCHCN